jgi:hypothetical protein
MIYIKDIVEDTYTNASGFVLYTVLKPYIESKNCVIVSFEGKLSCSTSFLNSSFGQLIEEFGIDSFKTNIKLTDITKTNASFIKKYVTSFMSLEK